MFRGASFSILNNAIDTKLYLFDINKRKIQRDKWGIKSGELLVGHVGRFFPQKNHVFLVDIFNEIQERVPSKLILVGNDNEQLASAIKEKIENLGLKDKVIFTGLRNDVADLMQAMDAFVFPSNYEGLPMTIIEAQASSLPCFISDKVPIDCNKTCLVHQIPLSDSAQVWAEKVIEASQIKRKNMYEEIKNAGFDITENASRLQKYYISKAGE
jgi:glycosyltransferase involved in cell wall biosynthesis